MAVGSLRSYGSTTPRFEIHLKVVWGTRDIKHGNRLEIRITTRYCPRIRVVLIEAKCYYGRREGLVLSDELLGHSRALVH